MSKELAPLSDPGLPEHIHRKADVDLKAAKKSRATSWNFISLLSLRNLALYLCISRN
jgi:ubiquinol-cytochrome c reductase iron-sulfur subunit